MKFLYIILFISPPILLIAQPEPVYIFDSEAVSYQSETFAAEEQETLATSKTFEKARAPYLRLVFGPTKLGDDSYLKLYGYDPDKYQLIDQTGLENSDFHSAVFAGDFITVELYTSGEDENVFFSVNEVLHGQPEDEQDSRTICGTDNRVLSNDVRVGRLSNGCTAWLLSNGTVATAGHCVTDNNGNVNISNATIVEFNVPLSNPVNGANNPSDPEDQYNVRANTLEFEYAADGTNSCKCGEDWALFRLSPNTTTGLTVFAAQGDFFRPQLSNPAGGSNNNSITITGFGNDTDGPAQNDNAQQTHTDDYNGEFVIPNEGIIYEYSADTEGGNSGSPIIRASNPDFSYGIHVCGGCGGSNGCTGNAFNVGVSFDHNPLQIEMSDYYSAATYHVDRISWSSAETGSAFYPDDSVMEGHNRANSSTFSNLILVRGSYNETNGSVLTNKLLIRAPVGSVFIY